MLYEHLIVFIIVPKLLSKKKKKGKKVVAFHPTKKKILDHIFYSMFGIFEIANRKLSDNIAGGNDFFDFHFL